VPRMSTAGDDRPRTASDLSPVTLALASLASVVATVTVSRFGLAGTLAGAALAPVVIAVVRELGRSPVERVVRLPSGARTVVERGPRVRPRTVALTAGLAFAGAVAFFTVPDMIAGTSVVSDRPSTFFSPGDGTPGSDGGATTTPTGTGDAPVTAPPADDPATAPEPVTTAPAPATTTPAEPPPAATAPAPTPPPPATPAAPAQPPG
jgi:hypothetical protein